MFFAPLPAFATAIALVGDLAPNTNGGVFSLVVRPDLSGTGDVSFYGVVTGGTASLGVFVGNGGTTSAVALDGMAAPGTGGGIFTSFIFPSIRINSPGDVAFVGNMSGGIATSGVFIKETGALSLITLIGDAAPGTGGGTFASFSLIGLNNAGEVAFTSAVLEFPPSSGVFRASTSTSTLIAEAGDAVPDVAGAIFEAFGTPVLNDAGVRRTLVDPADLRMRSLFFQGPSGRLSHCKERQHLGLAVATLTSLTRIRQQSTLTATSISNRV